MNNNWWAQESSINQNPSFSGSISWRRQWHPTPVLLPGKSHGWRNLEGCSHGVAECRTRLSDFTSLFTFMHWRRKCQPTPVFLPGESRGRGAWWAAVYGVTQSRTRLKWLSSSLFHVWRLSFFFCPLHEACRILVPWPGIEPVFPALRATTELSGKSNSYLLIGELNILIIFLAG